MDTIKFTDWELLAIEESLKTGIKDSRICKNSGGYLLTKIAKEWERRNMKRIG